GPIDTRLRDQEMTSWWELLRLIFQPLTTYQTEFAHYIEVHLPIELAPAFNYGYAMPTLGFGLAALALAQLAWGCARVMRTGANGPRQLGRAGFTLARAASAAVVVLAVAAFFFVFPITRLARYLGFAFACAGALAPMALVDRR